MSQLCDDAEMDALVEAIRTDDRTDLTRVEAVLERHPGDPRLHFLRASLLVARERPVEAHDAFRRALEIAPDFPLARFQMGFFELTSGEASEALATWGPLLRLPDDHCLRQFVEGLTHMIRDEFPQAAERLASGIALNDDNPALSHDMGLLREQCERLAAGEGAGRSDRGDRPADAVSSPTSFILNQFSSQTKH